MKVTLATPTRDTTAIAIVGAACRLPHAADLDAFASLLERGEDAVGEIPPDRWARDLFYHPDSAVQGKSYTFAAGCLDHVDQFDPAFFGISPREAAQMDPQQRLLLELTVEALEDAGIRPSTLSANRTSVHIGGSSSDYVTLRLGDPSSADAYFMTGSSLCSLSNRISHALDLHGPSFTVDSACSSSLVALHLACESLRNGDSEVALAGGVNLLLAPQSFVGFSRAGMLSPTGRCHAFDQSADGYVRAEGGGVLVLKPLAAALADNDSIHAVIRATAVNSDGRTTGFSLPSEAAQAALLRDIYDGFGLRPDDLAYLEAHGTGTPAGDPIEASAIGAVLGSRRSRPLPIGSVKTNIGHLEAASGIAGLLKLIVAIRQHTVPRSLHMGRPNQAIPFSALNLSLATVPLPLTGAPESIMGINSFGFGGTNAHAVLQAPPVPEITGSGAAPPMLLLSARSEPALADLAQAWRSLLVDSDPSFVAPWLRGAARGREAYPHRLAVLASNSVDLACTLEHHLGGGASTKIVGDTALRDTGGLVFAFSGNGSQWAGMAQDALARSHVFGAALDEVDCHLAPLLGWSVRAALEQPDVGAMRRIDVAQPLLFAVQVASVMALHAAGVVATAHLGHSAGEVAAAWASGALSLPDAACIIVVRSRLQQSRHGVGRMAVLGLTPDEAEAATGDLHGVSIAAINSRTVVTIAGPENALAAVAARATANGWSYLPLDLDYAFHSPAMDPIQERLRADLAGLIPRHAHTPFISTVTGCPADGTMLDAGYWWRNVRAPVRFATAANYLVQQGVRLFLEIGPQAVLQSFLRDALAAAEATGRVLPVLTRRPVTVDPFLLAAARCHVAGYDISAGPLFDGPVQYRGLPHYPWQRERCWFDRTSEATDQLSTPRSHCLLGFRRAGVDRAWFNHVDLATQPWLADHVVNAAVLLPAAAMIDLALAACATAYPGAAVFEVRDLDIVRPVLLEPNRLLELAFTHDEAGKFTFCSRLRLSAEQSVCHATGHLDFGPVAEPLFQTSNDVPVGPVFAEDDFYERTAALGLAYGPAFRTVRRFAATGLKTAVLDLADPPPPYPALIDPTLLDGALQGLAVLAGIDARLGRMVVLPTRFGRVRLFARATPPSRVFLRITAAGPRSICADMLLVTTDDLPVIELLNCWCVAIPKSPEIGGEQALVSVLIPTLPADIALALPDRSTPPFPATESLMLAEACLSGTAFNELALLADTDGFIVSRHLADQGSIAPGGVAVLDMLLDWLEYDGLASRQGNQIALAPESGLPSTSRLFGSLLFDLPGNSAEAALLAAFAGALPQRLHGDSPPALPASLLDQLRSNSPSAEAMIDAIVAAVELALAAWPAGRRLRVLEIDCGSGALSRRLLHLFSHRPDCSYFAVAPDVEVPSGLHALFDSHPGARLLRAGSPEAVALRDIDIAVGIHCLTSKAGTAALLSNALCSGGHIFLAEAAPNRLWQALASIGLPCSGGLRSGDQWIQILEDAGFVDCHVTPVATSFWPAGLLTGRCLCAAPSAAAEPPSALQVCALEQDGCTGWPAALADVRSCNELDLQEWLSAAPRGILALLVPTPAPQASTATIAALLARLACLAAPLAGAATLSTMLAVRASADADPFGAALLGFRRVLANEIGIARCRLLRIDPSFTAAEADSLLRRELADDDGEDEIAWTPAGRLVPRVRRLPKPIPGPDRPPVSLAIGSPGLLGSLVWNSLPECAPAPDEVLIEVTAAGLNFRDVMWAMGLLPDEALLRGFAGATLGLECAGRVVAVGRGVSGYTPGMRVMGLAPAALASRVVTAAHALMPIPDGISDAEAATIPVASLTVAYALGHLAHLAAGERVLIHGAAGGVGLMAIQYARARGAEIFVTAGSQAKRATLQLLGVAHVMDSRSLSFADEILRVTNGEGVDVVLNCLSGTAMERGLGLLRPFGRFLELGKRDLYGNTSVGLRPLRHNVTYFAIDADQLPAAQPAFAKRLFGEVCSMLQDGALRPLPYRRFDFSEAESAFRLMQSSGHLGKIILTPGSVPPSPSEPDVFTARSDGSYVLTGALSGFGRSTVLWLLARGARHIAVLSRTGPADPAASTLAAECAARGAHLLVLACDVASEPQVDASLRQVRAALPPIVGVIHCAMVLQDSLLPQQDANRIDAVLRPKLAGALALDRLTRGDPIELFLLFSSIVTTLGNPGQAGYVAANSAIEALAERRHTSHLPALAVAWGPIADEGVLARDPALSASLARRIGAPAMRADQALAALPRLIASGVSVVSFANIQWSTARAQLPALVGRLTEDLLTETATALTDTDFRSSLAGLPPDQASARVAGLLIQQVAEILRLAPDRIDPDVPLADLGMDSLMAVELRIALERRFGVSLPLVSLSSGLTPAAMASRLMQSLADPAPRSMPADILAHHEPALGAPAEREHAGAAEP
jgi:acyl transferase domain-containing protein/NADPH:quinone reductase-like Zn-dependent oxidoreductase/acyl carrier protein/short-subunit dehydrogenase